MQPRPSPLPSKSSLLCRPGCPPRAPCNCPCTKSSASRSRRGVPCSAYCFRRSEEHTSELQSRLHLVCRLLLEKKKKKQCVTLLTTLNKTSDTDAYVV